MGRHKLADEVCINRPYSFNLKKFEAAQLNKYCKDSDKGYSFIIRRTVIDALKKAGYL